LASLEANRVAQAVLRVADDYAARTGDVPEVSDVLDYLENQERARFEAIAERAGYSKREAQAVAAEMAAGEPPPRPLTNAAAAERGSAPTDWRKMSERERIERAGREVFGKK